MPMFPLVSCPAVVLLLTYAPHVYRLGVSLSSQYDFWCSVPSSCYIVRHGASLSVLGVIDSREAKVAYLQVAITIDEKVTRLQVAMNHIGRVNKLQTAKDLVDEELDV